VAAGIEEALAQSNSIRARTVVGGPHFAGQVVDAASASSRSDPAIVAETNSGLGDCALPAAVNAEFADEPAGELDPRELPFRDCPSRTRRLRLDRAARSTLHGAGEHPEEITELMPVRGITERLSTLLATARRLLHDTESDGILVLAEWPFDWSAIRERLGNCKLLVAATTTAAAPAAAEADAPIAHHLDGIHWIHLEESDSPTHDRLTMALLEAVADERLRPGASVVALYRGFDDDEIDSLSVIRLDEHLEKLTAADLRKLETQVPLETLKAVVDLAVEIGREGREGHPVGTMFVVGDTRKVMKQTRPMGFDPFHGYSPKEKSLRDRRVREEIKEIAQLDGAFIIDATGDVVTARRYIDSPATGITMSKGLGSRHWAAASVTKSTKAIAIVVSQSSGTVRIFQNGQIVLRVEPLRRAMKWQEFESQPPQPPE